MQKSNDFSDLNVKDIENSLNSALINDMSHIIEKDKKTIFSYKILSCFLVVLLLLLLCIVIVSIMNY